MTRRSYTDDQLAAAVAGAHSWRGVLRALGLTSTSAGSARSVRRRAEELGISSGHFTGQRRWSDGRLAEAVRPAGSWNEVARRLGLNPTGGTLGALRAHAVRLGLDTEHLARRALGPSPDIVDPLVRVSALRNAGTLFAATWFTLHGATVSWPLEPCRYDLVADAAGTRHRVQVKTTTGAGPAAKAVLATSRRHGSTVYAPGEVDHFFVLDAELTAYLIPYEVVAGFGLLMLGRYTNFVVVEKGALLSAASSRGP